MADNEMMGLTYLVLAIYMIDLVTTFNIDTKAPYIYNEAQRLKGSYFGYSVAFNSDTQGIIVGAPFAFSNHTDEGTEPWGSVFNCVYSDESSERRCQKLHKVNTLKLGGEIKDNQMMGATVYSDHYRTMACAPRYKTRSTDGTTNFIYMPGKCEVIYPEYTDNEDWLWSPCATKISNDAAFGYCQTGFSAKFEKNKQMIGGCPSYKRSQGVLAFGERFTQFTNTTYEDNVYDYRGYSIGSGKLSTGNVESLIGGAPRANLLTGRVNVYKQTQAGFPISYHASDPSNQPGSYFGSAFAVANIDGDKSNLDDLVIGAPYYSSGQLPNEGAVYVYLNSGDGMALKQKLFGDKEKNACFGYSIGSVGDLNKDKRSDIAVGAPWGGPEGRGMVFIYYGTKSQEDPLILKQTLSPSILGGNAAQLNGFGYSFAEYYPYKVQDVPADQILNDVDKNEYPDLGIGAYRSDSVVILRSRPVVTVTGTLSIINTEGAKIQKIDLLDVSSASVCKAPDEKTYKCLKVEVGFELSGSGIGSTDVEYTLDVDSGQRKKRAFFLLRKGETRTTTHNDVMNVAKVKKIDTLTVYLLNDTKDVVHEMKITLKWVLKDQSSCGKNNKICPVLNQMEAVSTFKELPYIKGCSSDGNDECNADLVLTMTKSLTTIQSGLTKTIDIYIEIKNNGENAYINKLYIEYSSGIQPETVRITNHPGAVIWNIVRDRKNVAEVILSNPIRQNTKEKVRIIFGLSSMKTSLKQVSWKAQVHTESTEMKPADNNASISIDVVLVANLTITGNAAPEQLKWKKGVTSSSVPGQRIVHTFLLQNKGPSAVDDSDLEIRFPEKINGHYILNIINVKLDGSRKSQVDPAVCDVGQFNPLKISGLDTARTAKSSNNITRSGRRRREVSQGLNCGDKSVECRIIKCKLNNLKKLDDVTVTITSTLVEATFETHIKVNKKIGVYAKFASKKVSKPAKDAAKDNIEVYFTVVTPYGTMTAESKPLAWWIILICVLAALLIIIIVAYILYKKKFFERNRPPAEEEETLKNGDLEGDEY